MLFFVEYFNFIRKLSCMNSEKQFFYMQNAYVPQKPLGWLIAPIGISNPLLRPPLPNAALPKIDYFEKIYAIFKYN